MISLVRFANVLRIAGEVQKTASFEFSVLGVGKRKGRLRDVVPR